MRVIKVKCLTMPMCPRFDSRTRRHMWVAFLVGSRPCSEGFSPSSKINISNFQFNRKFEGQGFVSRRLLCVILVKQSCFIYLFYLIKISPKPISKILRSQNLSKSWKWRVKQNLKTTHHFSLTYLASYATHSESSTTNSPLRILYMLSYVCRGLPKRSLPIDYWIPIYASIWSFF